MIGVKVAICTGEGGAWVNSTWIELGAPKAGDPELAHPGIQSNANAVAGSRRAAGIRRRQRDAGVVFTDSAKAIVAQSPFAVILRWRFDINTLIFRLFSGRPEAPPRRPYFPSLAPGITASGWRTPALAVAAAVVL
jgi:hypothetical protein